MDFRIDEIGESLSGIFRATFVDGTDKYYLEIDINLFEDIPFLIGKDWLKTFLPEVMNLKISVDYEEIPVEYARKIYENLAKNGWTTPTT